MAGLLLSRSTGLLTTPDGHGRSPLHVAAAHGHGRLVELLLGQGADINAADKVHFGGFIFKSPLFHSWILLFRLDGRPSI